jgi:hypothetical protein
MSLCGDQAFGIFLQLLLSVREQLQSVVFRALLLAPTLIDIV